MVTQLLRFFLPRDQRDSDSLRYLSYLPDRQSLSLSRSPLSPVPFDCIPPSLPLSLPLSPSNVDPSPKGLEAERAQHELNNSPGGGGGGGGKPRN